MGSFYPSGRSCLSWPWKDEKELRRQDCEEGSLHKSRSPKGTVQYSFGSGVASSRWRLHVGASCVSEASVLFVCFLKSALSTNALGRLTV